MVELETSGGSKDEIRSLYKEDKKCAEKARELLDEYSKLLDEQDEGK